MLRVGQFYSGTETGGWRKIHQVTETRDRVARVTISSSVHKHFSLIVAEGPGKGKRSRKLTGGEWEGAWKGESGREKAEKVELRNKARGLCIHTGIYRIQAQINIPLPHPFSCGCWLRVLAGRWAIINYPSQQQPSHTVTLPAMQGILQPSDKSGFAEQIIFTHTSMFTVFL